MKNIEEKIGTEMTLKKSDYFSEPAAKPTWKEQPRVQFSEGTSLSWPLKPLITQPPKSLITQPLKPLITRHSIALIAPQTPHHTALYRIEGLQPPNPPHMMPRDASPVCVIIINK